MDCRGHWDPGRGRRTTRCRTRRLGKRPTRRPPWPAVGGGAAGSVGGGDVPEPGGAAVALRQGWGMSAVSTASSARVRADSAWPARVSSSSLVSRPCTNAVFSVSITCSRSASPALSRSSPAGARCCCPAITGTFPSTMQVERSATVGSSSVWSSSLAGLAAAAFGRRRYEVVVEGIHHGGGAVPQLQLDEHVVDVGLDRPLADEQSGGDLGVRLALSDEREDLALAAGERCRGLASPGDSA